MAPRMRGHGLLASWNSLSKLLPKVTWGKCILKGPDTLEINIEGSVEVSFIGIETGLRGEDE